MKILLFLLFASILSAQTPVINEIMSLNIAAMKDEDGDYPDWIELYNPALNSVSLKDFALSDDPGQLMKWRFPDAAIPAQGWLLVFASGKDKSDGAFLHANFKISSKGETILFVSPDGAVLDSITAPPLAVDVSYGRTPDAGPNRAYFAAPTPGRSNDSDPATGVAEAPRFSMPGGFYDDAISVHLSAPGGRIRYSTNGGNPNSHSRSYTNAIRISKTTVIKARLFVDDKLPSPVATQTFFIDEAQTLAVISLSTHPDNLFDEDIGIYVVGNGTALGGYPDNPIGPPANYWEDWERPAHLELFEPDGDPGFSIDAGIKMAGKTTRRLPQKSFSVYMRNQYGADRLDYPLYPDSPVRTFRSFMLRNAGSDNTHNEGGVHFRDGLAATLLNGLDLDHQNYRPCALYINGDYWGIYGIREKLNEDYLAAHWGVDPNNVDILDDYHSLYPLALEGDAEDYNALIDYLKAHDLGAAAAAAYVETRIDIDNYLAYMATEIYLANQDGPGHNGKFWRPRTEDGRYRWLLYDVDHSFGLRLFIPNYHYAPDAYTDDTIAYYLEASGPSWPNPPESTFMFRKIMQNRGFRIRFVNRLADMLNSRFSEESALGTFVELRDRIEAEIDRHLQRWGGSKSQWRQNTRVVDDFLANRSPYLQEYVIDHFDLGGLAEVSLTIEPPDAGRIKLNSLIISSEWSGLYFQDAPIEVTALPTLGYAFDGWEGMSQTSASVRISLVDDIALTARFRASENRDLVVINEINYNSPEDFDTKDWIELYNPLPKAVDLAGWTLADDDSGEAFVFGSRAAIPSGSYLVVCRKVDDFSRHWPNVSPIVGDLPFGLNSDGDVLVLKDAQGASIDSVAYSSSPPWPWQPNSGGATLALRNANDDNLLAENWMASVDHGTPGAANRVIGNVENQIPTEFKLWVFPNPFNSTATIEYNLPAAQQVTVQIFDVLGRRIITLTRQKQDAGLHSVKWRGQTEGGLAAASGVCFVRLTGARFVKMRKILLVR